MTVSPCLQTHQLTCISTAVIFSTCYACCRSAGQPRRSCLEKPLRPCDCKEKTSVTHAVTTHGSSKYCTYGNDHPLCWSMYIEIHGDLVSEPDRRKNQGVYLLTLWRPVAELFHFGLKCSTLKSSCMASTSFLELRAITRNMHRSCWMG